MALDIPINKATENVSVTVRVIGMRRWNARMRVATWIVGLAARVAPFGMKVEVETNYASNGHAEADGKV